MVKILKPVEKKNNVTIIGNKGSNSVTTGKIPEYLGYKDKDPFKKR